MTEIFANPESEAGRQARRPLQFSIRSLLVAAVLVSLYLGAIKSLDDWPLFLVLSILSWLTWGGLLLRFRATRPLCMLAAGPVFLALFWTVYFAASGLSRDVGIFGPVVPVTAAFAFSWGIVASLMIALSLGVARIFLRAARRLRPELPQEGERRPPPTGLFRPSRFVMLVVLTRMLISVAVFPAAFHRGNWVCWIAYFTNFALDMPYVPVFVEHTGQPDTFRESLLFVIITGVCGAVLYALVAAFVAAVGGQLKRRPPSFAEPEPLSQ